MVLQVMWIITDTRVLYLVCSLLTGKTKDEIRFIINPEETQYVGVWLYVTVELVEL